VAILLVVVLSPLFLLAIALIKLQDGGPLLSFEWRLGQRGQMFQLLKFRIATNSTCHRTENVGIDVRPTDLPNTPMGRWLKRSHLDKLPMLFNVLRGDMSLVGPHAWAIYETLVLPPELRTRLHTLPGITGSLQRLADFPAANSKLVAKELQELRQWSLWKDFQQLTVTTLQVFS
jgi:lipopolysaccharide/colanic/teichoic acid biosynthesis glycosyltransferase